MKLYKITWYIKSPLYSNGGNVTVSHSIWAGTQAQSAALRGSIRQKSGYVPNSVKTEIINVPTDKKGLLGFLNGDHIESTDPISDLLI